MKKDRDLLAKLGLATLEPDRSMVAPEINPDMPACPSLEGDMAPQQEGCASAAGCC